jgi:malonyl-CoA/methylmalonyl-CoA synthetase
VSDLHERSVAAWRRHLGCAVEPHDLIARLSRGSLPEAFHAMAAAAPERPALDVDGSARTHGELDAAAGRFAALLREHGVAAGDRVLFSAPSSIAMVEAYLGVLRAGATVVLANPSYTRGELHHLASDSGAVIAVAAGQARAILAELADELPALQGVVDVETATAEFEPLAAESVDGDQAALLAYTSGTTGRPKAVPLTHANVLASIRAAMFAWRWTAGDVLVHSLPLFHQHGLSGVHATLLSGCRAVIAGKFDPEWICRTIASEGGTILLGVPAIYERLTAWDGIGGTDLSSLRLVVSGSAPLSPALAARVERTLGQIPLERYGTTESGLDVSNPYGGPRRPGTVGIPLPGIEMRVVGDAGDELPDGDDGEIVVRGPQVFGGYAGDETAVADSFYPGGWFRTGDIGNVDPADGYVSITGRAKELIISGGMNVYPREIELVLEDFDPVARAVVVGVPSERWGEEVVAAVVGNGGEEIVEEAVLEFVRDRLAPYKRPKRVVVVERLPTNEMGKVLRSEVVRLVER